MAQTWNDSTLPWQTWDGTNLVYKDPSMPWNNTDLPWKAGAFAIQLSASQDTEDDAQGTVIGTISGGTGPYTVTDANSYTQVNVDGVTLEVGSSAPPVGTASIIIHDTGTPAAADANFTITTIPAALSSFTWASDQHDQTPDFNGGLPATALAGDTLRIEYDIGAGFQLYVTYVLQPTDISGGSVSGVASANPLADGAYTFRARLERSSLGSSYKTASVTIDAVAPVLTSPTGSPLTDTTASLSVSTNKAEGTLYYVVSSSATPPTAAQVKAGHDSSGGAGEYAGSQSVSSTGSKSATATGLTAGTVYAYFMHEDAAGNQSSVSASASWTQQDTTAPVLSSASGSGASSTTASLSVSTNEGNGTLYWVVSTSITPPSVAQIKLGHDSGGGASAASGNQSVSGTGTQSATASGLTTSTTYYAYFMQEDAAANDSSVASSTSFTLSATNSTWLLEAGTDHWELEDASGNWILEAA